MSTTGSGTKADPYVITTYDDFYTLTHNIGTERWIKLANNIDLNYATWDVMWSGLIASQQPKCHVDLNGYGFLHIVVPSVQIFKNSNYIDSYLFCGYEWYNGTIDVHSDPDDLTPPITPLYLGWHGSLTCSTTTYTNIKFTGYLNVVPTGRNNQLINETVVFRGMFNYCQFDMDVNFSSYVKEYMETRQVTGTLQAVFRPSYNQTITDYLQVTPNQYQMMNCDVNIRVYNWCYPDEYGAVHTCYYFRYIADGTFSIYNNRFRGSMGSRLKESLAGWFMTSYATSNNRDYIHNNVVSINFRNAKIPTDATTDLVSSRSGYQSPDYQNNVFNTDYLSYVRLRHRLTANGFTGCSISEITNATRLQSKGFPASDY